MSKRKPFSLGDRVYLKSGSQVMTIERAGKINGRLVFQCVWIGDDKAARSTFYAETLEHA